MVLLTTPPSGEAEFWPFALVYLVVICIVLMPIYVMNAYPLFAIARRRGLKHAWLAWVPIGGAYVLGNISDDYQLMNRDNLKNRRIWLPVLQGLTVVLIVAIWVWALFSFGNENPLGIAGLPFVLAAMAVCVVGAVMKWMATYDLFRSCEPYRAGVYLAICLGIRFVMPAFSIVREILMLVVCQKDQGMPRQVLPEKEPWEN